VLNYVRLTFPEAMSDQFKKRTYTIYRHQKARAGTLPFTLEEFRAALRSFLARHPLCRYCNALVSIRNVSLDHRRPVSRGGNYGLDNIDFICAGDNKAKGDFTGEEYTDLLKHLERMEAKFANPGIKKRVVDALRISQSFRHGARRRAESSTKRVK
jgi:HNH endonuclease